MGSIPATPSTKHASCFPPSSMPASIEISIKLIVCLSASDTRMVVVAAAVTAHAATALAAASAVAVAAAAAAVAADALIALLACCCCPGRCCRFRRGLSADYEHHCRRCSATSDGDLDMLLLRSAGPATRSTRQWDERADRLAADGLPWTIDCCCIDNGLRRPLISSPTD